VGVVPFAMLRTSPEPLLFLRGSKSLKRKDPEVSGAPLEAHAPVKNASGKSEQSSRRSICIAMSSMSWK